MATTSLQKKYSPGSVMVRYLKGKFEALRYLPALAGGFLKFNAAGELEADNSPSISGDLLLGRNLVGSIDARSGAGAVSITALTTQLTTTGADALTLANGVAGQFKRIVMVADGGDGTLTPATKTGFATITFGDVGDSVLLQYHTTLGWTVVANNGCTIA